MSADSFDEPNLQALLEKIARDENFNKPKFRVINTTKPGENYIGRIFQAEIFETCETEPSRTLSLVFKVSPSCEGLKSMISDGNVFRIESNVYTIILPALNDLLKKYGVYDTTSFPGTARCFGTEVQEGSADGLSDVIVMENKKAQNFVVIEDTKGLDLIQCQMALEKLAIFHATSMAANILHPELTKSFKKALANGAWSGNNKRLLDDMKLGLQLGLGFLADPYKKGNAVYDKLHQVWENFLEAFTKLHETPEDLVCLMHGDVWINNILFKLNEDGVTDDVCLLDYQITSFSSPAIDVSRLLFFCTTKEFRDEHFESLLRFYFDEVARVLRSFGCDVETTFPWSKFQTHLRLYSLSPIITCVLGIPLIMAHESETKKDTHASEGDYSIFEAIANITDPENIEAIKKRLTDIVVDAERRGYI